MPFVVLPSHHHRLNMWLNTNREYRIGMIYGHASDLYKAAPSSWTIEFAESRIDNDIFQLYLIRRKYSLLLRCVF